MAGLGRLFWLSFASLFLELILIRWLAVEINLFAHLRNFVLVACLLGLGLGYACQRPRVPAWWTPVGLALLVGLICLPTPARPLLVGLSTQVAFASVYAYQPGPQTSWAGIVSGLALACLLLGAVGSLFFPLGQALGHEFVTRPERLQSYLVNLVGSLLGVLAYTGLSAISSPPQVWFLVGIPVLAAAMPTGRERFVCILLGAFTALAPGLVGQPAAVAEVHWSPYQRVRLWGFQPVQAAAGKMGLRPNPGGKGDPQMWLVEANGVGLWILDMSASLAARHPWLKPPGRIEFYDLPYRIYPNPERVLIMGAGGGNDVAAALRGGAAHVDAVELDPHHAALGYRLHPEHPYQDPRVELHINDARNFLKRTPHKYDLVCFSLLDNVNLTSNYSNLRLDSFVYTREAFEEARARLKPGGLMVMYAGDSSPFAHKIGSLLGQVFGMTPAMFHCENQYLFEGSSPIEFLVGDSERIERGLKEDPELAAFAAQRRIQPEPTSDAMPTDDWPYWCLDRRAIPSLQVVVALLAVALGALLVRLLLPGSGFRWNYFFLGAGFMLLEAHVITKMALLFGVTWIVNAFVISGVLLMVIAANLVVLRFPQGSSGLAYLGLLATLLLQWVLPPDLFLGSVWVGLPVLFYTLPVFFAGLVFSRAFRHEPEPGLALGANLFGSVVGGVLDILSYALGMRALVLVLAGIYLAAALTRPR